MYTFGGIMFHWMLPWQLTKSQPCQTLQCNTTNYKDKMPSMYQFVAMLYCTLYGRGYEGSYTENLSCAIWGHGTWTHSRLTRHPSPKCEVFAVSLVKPNIDQKLRVLRPPPIFTRVQQTLNLKCSFERPKWTQPTRHTKVRSKDYVFGFLHKWKTATH